MPEPRGWTGCPRRTRSAIGMRDDRSTRGAAIRGQCLGAAAYKPVSRRCRCGKWCVPRVVAVGQDQPCLDAAQVARMQTHRLREPKFR